MIENEFTYLVKDIPSNIASYPSEKILQGYLSEGVGNLRIRQKGNKYELTKKTPLREGDFSRFNETTIYLSKQEFDKIWPLTVKSLEKTRYYIDLEHGLKAELDVYEGDLKGFAVVEVEFPSEELRSKFTPPSWFGKDITQLEWSANEYLAGKSYQDILPLIS